MSPILLILIILLIIVLINPSWPYAANWGYYPSGLLGIILIVLLILALLGKL